MSRFLAVLLLFSSALTALASRRLTDELGRTVTVPDHPHRIICLAPSVVDDIYELGAGADVVAVSDFTKFPAEAMQKPSVGTPLTPSLEKILSLHPDLVLGVGEINQMDRLRPLEQYGIPVFMVHPHTLHGIYLSLENLGKAIHREDSARSLIEKLKSREQQIRAKTAGKPQIRIFMPIWYDPVITIGKDDYITQMIELAGAKSVTDDIGLPWPHISLEAVIVRKPDALLLVRSGKMSVKQLASLPGWNTMHAVQAGNVFWVDDRIDLPSPIAFDALEDLARQFHPEL